MEAHKTSSDIKFIKYFNEIHLSDTNIVGGKNASIGEMNNLLSSLGIKVPIGFAITIEAYWEFIYFNKLKEPITELLKELDKKNYANLKEIGEKIRTLMLSGILPSNISKQIIDAYRDLQTKYKINDVAVRSSATAEDLPSASFAGQHDSFLNIFGEELLLIAVHHCFVSLFTDRAIKYREDNEFNHMQVAMSIGIQKMVRSDLSCSGTAFTIEPESGFKDIIHIAGCWGLGDNIVQGAIIPDEFYVFKPTFKEGKNAIVSKKLGSKLKTLIYSANTDHDPEITVVNHDTPVEKTKQFVINNKEINKIAEWALAIEKHYGRPMDIEWAKDGITAEIFIVQARPETGHTKTDWFEINEYKLKEKGKILTSGSAIGDKITSGIARILNSPKESAKLNKNEIVVTEITNPDWDPIMKKAGAIITNSGGRTSHASIVARELGLPAIVGTDNGTEKIKDGEMITVSCAEGEIGNVYEGKLDWEKKGIDRKNIVMPKTQVMMILGDPKKAFKLSFYPNNGIGLLRIEFIINNSIKVHPMALVKFNVLKDQEAKKEIEKLSHLYTDKKEYFIDKLAQSVATIACAFYPKEVIVRMSDFKTNEYANLIGGKEFETHEQNPMIGFRGASRYYSEKYKEAFRLECAAMKKVRDEMGLSNVKLMIPFCRTIEEGKKVVKLMEENGLKRGVNGLEIYVMVEIPSNVILVDEFAEIFDGFSIGSNDLTQLTLGIDRDSGMVSGIFNEENQAVKKLIVWIIAAAKRNKKKIGLCGQAPSDHPEFARFLVKQNIDSIAFVPDALIKGIENINKAEAEETEKNSKQIGFVLTGLL
ncbi:MAG: phosphoenolpyruvate synthase [Bacteroidetes bacterium RIFCSPLOWO2_12_FULL_35_15]|nr:MAG: phosphoenolpyruvate synthase [Bacteroidetes bacterium RIFCSPLOWO2_12_FULL_35_15]